MEFPEIFMLQETKFFVSTFGNILFKIWKNGQLVSLESREFAEGFVILLNRVTILLEIFFAIARSVTTQSYQ